MTGTSVVVLLLVLGASTVVGLVWRSRQGRLRDVAPAPSDGPGSEDLRPLVTSLGGAVGERATLLQFSSAFCAPCRATRRVLGEVAGMVEGVTHVEVDAEQHLDVVRRLRVLTTPTTLVLDHRGRVVTRAAGQPRTADVVAAVGRATRAPGAPGSDAG